MKTAIPCSINTKQEIRKRVLTKWAEQRLFEKYCGTYYTCTYTFRHKYDCVNVCVVTPAGSVYNPAV